MRLILNGFWLAKEAIKAHALLMLRPQCLGRQNHSSCYRDFYQNLNATFIKDGWHDGKSSDLRAPWFAYQVLCRNARMANRRGQSVCVIWDAKQRKFKLEDV